MSLLNIDQISKSLEWGVSALTLGYPVQNIPKLNETMSDWEDAVVLDKFFHSGGTNNPITHTQAYITWDENSLYVGFYCFEPDLSQVYLQHNTDLFTLSCKPMNQDSAFPDKVDVYVRPSFDKEVFYQFTVTLQGLSSAQRFDSFPILREMEPILISGYQTDIQIYQASWNAQITIPWTKIGIMPLDTFGLMVSRTRWRNSERISPVPQDFTDKPALDLFMEISFGTKNKVHIDRNSLIKLPSGKFRWQRPAFLNMPPLQIKQAIWQLQQDITIPTTLESLSERLQLTQMWMDMMILEGFNFRVFSGTILERELMPETMRLPVNRHLLKGEIKEACEFLDIALKHIDKASRSWYADGSPGNILDNEWNAIQSINYISCNGYEVIFECNIGVKVIKLYISCPIEGGIRLRGVKEGFFKPEGLKYLEYTHKGNDFKVLATDLCIHIKKDTLQVVITELTRHSSFEFNLTNIAFRYLDDGRSAAFRIVNKLKKNEKLYGFGERFDAVYQRNKVITLWGMDDYVGVTAGLRNQQYKPIPLYHSTESYSVFFNTTYRLRADIGCRIYDQYDITLHGDILDFYLWVSSPSEVIKSYSNLTGKPLIPPKWAFEAWMGGTHGRWADGVKKDPVLEMIYVADRFKELDIPHSAIYAEGKASKEPALFSALECRKIRILMWSSSSISAEQITDATMILENYATLFCEDGTVFKSRHGPYIDFTKSRAFEMLEAKLERCLKLGVAGSMVDFGDRVPEGAIFHDGRRGEEMHNFYAYDYHKTFKEVLYKYRGNDQVLFGRSASAGDQQWVCHFSGDHSSNYTGLTASINGCLNMAACGFSNLIADIGGFAGWPSHEVYMRWLLWSAFTPIMRYQGTEPREPWEYGDDAVSLYKKCAWLRHNFLEYLYSSAVEAHVSGIPMMRLLCIDFPNNPHLVSCDDAYMFGKDLLVAPIHTSDHFRTIPFPKGEWTNLWTGAVVEGETILEVTASLDTIPVYLRAGAIIPVFLNRLFEWGGSMSASRVQALVVTRPNIVETVRLYSAPEVFTEFLSKPQSGGFTISLDGYADLRYIVVYGSRITGVKFNGTILIKLVEADSIENRSLGWYCDEKFTIIRIPQCMKKNIEIII